MVIVELNNMVLTIIIIGAAVCTLALFINIIEDYNNKLKTRISFKDSIDIVDLPVISLSNNGKIFNFIIDTGSTYSILNVKILNKLKYNEIPNMLGTAYGIDGNIINVNYINLVLHYNKVELEDVFQVIEVPAFDNIKEQNNIEIAGILGNTFLKKYKYIIDFNKMMIYTKK